MDTTTATDAPRTLAMPRQHRPPRTVVIRAAVVPRETAKPRFTAVTQRIVNTPIVQPDGTVAWSRRSQTRQLKLPTAFPLPRARRLAAVWALTSLIRAADTTRFFAPDHDTAEWLANHKLRPLKWSFTGFDPDNCAAHVLADMAEPLLATITVHAPTVTVHVRADPAAPSHRQVLSQARSAWRTYLVQRPMTNTAWYTDASYTPGSGAWTAGIVPPRRTGAGPLAVVDAHRDMTSAYAEVLAVAATVLVANRHGDTAPVIYSDCTAVLPYIDRYLAGDLHPGNTPPYVIAALDAVGTRWYDAALGWVSARTATPIRIAHTIGAAHRTTARAAAYRRLFGPELPSIPYGDLMTEGAATILHRIA